jgi:hypothetical protein
VMPPSMRLSHAPPSCLTLPLLMRRARSSFWLPEVSSDLGKVASPAVQQSVSAAAVRELRRARGGKLRARRMRRARMPGLRASLNPPLESAIGTVLLHRTALQSD